MNTLQRLTAIVRKATKQRSQVERAQDTAILAGYRLRLLNASKREDKARRARLQRTLNKAHRRIAESFVWEIDWKKALID